MTNRFDQLNVLYQHKNEWEKAIRVAEEEDRVNLKQTYFKAARNYEQHKRFTEAITYYEQSETHLEEVPRMLNENQQFNALLEYAEKVQDKSVFSYIGQVYEKYGDIDEAKNFYTKGANHGALCRVHIERAEVDSAESIANTSEDPTACLWVAKHFEESQDYRKAINFYKKGRHFLQAVRLATQGGDEDEIFAAASQAPAHVQAKTGIYFEKKGLISKAIQLYKKGRNFRKALRLAQSHNLPELVPEITVEMNKAAANQEMLSNLGDAYADQGNPESAFGMFVGSGQIDKAADLLEQHNITLTPDIVKKMIPQRGQTDAENNRRDKIVGIIAKRLRDQGKFEASAKLYLDINQLVKAIKAVIESGKVDKVVQFANQAKSDEVYVLAANFLQNQDLKSDENLIKNINLFYTKAKKWDSLMTFYISCAMLEISDYEDYDKALTALEVALRVG